MVSMYSTQAEHIHKLESIEPGCWVHLMAPTEEEVARVCEALNLDPDAVRAALDEEERARLEVEDNYTLILVDTPMVEAGPKGFIYSTIPLSIIMTGEVIVTVCLKENPLLMDFYEGRVRGFSTRKLNRFVLQMLYRNATRFLFYLRQIDKASYMVEGELHKSMKNKELIQMLTLEKSLVYFSTSLKSNEVVMERLLRMDFIRAYPDDMDLLEDVIIENKQAIEMCTIYRDILSDTMDAFASVISNNLNIVMKLLTSITIIMTIPTLIASIWGMNVPVPFEHSANGFWIVLGITAGVTLLGTLFMARRKML